MNPIAKTKDILHKTKPYRKNFGTCLFLETFIFAFLKMDRAYSFVIKRYLDKRFKKRCLEFYKEYKVYHEKLERSEKIVWSIWWQGEKDLPEVVRISRTSLFEHCKDYKIILLSRYNINDYIHIPDYILEKVESKQLSFVHLADYIRVAVLKKYGGIWADATVFFTGDLPSEYFEREFVSRHTNDHSGKTVAAGRWSGYFMGTGYKETLIYSFLEFFYDEYYKDFNMSITYLLQDYIFDMACRFFPEFQSVIDKMVPNNIGNKFLQDNLNSDYNDETWQTVCKSNIFQKLTWKKSIIDSPGTYYKTVTAKYLNAYRPFES